MRNKLLLLIAGLVLSISASAQSQIDSVLFKLINEYRVSKGVQPMKWDSSISKMAVHHSEYMIQYPYTFHQAVTGDFCTDSISPHEERVPVQGIDRVVTVSDRFKRFVPGGYGIYGSENICFGGAGKYVNMSANEIAKDIFEGWKNSPKHNENMLNPTLRSGACCTVMKKIYTTNYFVNGKVARYKELYIVSTADFLSR